MVLQLEGIGSEAEMCFMFKEPGQWTEAEWRGGKEQEMKSGRT